MLPARLVELASILAMTDDDLVRRVRFLRVLPSSDRERLLATSETTTLKRGERVWQEGDPPNEFSFVVSGRVKLVKSGESGRDAALEVVATRELLCGSVASTCSPYCCNGVAMEDGTEVLSLRRTDVLDLLERSPAVARSLLHEIASRGADMCCRVEELSAGQVEQRIAKLLLRLAQRSGVDRPGQGTWVPVPLTRQDLAELCGTTVETAIRVMSRLRRRGVVRAAARGFMVTDLRELEAIVASGPRGDVSLSPDASPENL